MDENICTFFYVYIFGIPLSGFIRDHMSNAPRLLPQYGGPMGGVIPPAFPAPFHTAAIPPLG